MFSAAPSYYGTTGQLLHSHHHYNNTKQQQQHNNYNYQLNKIENGINSINIGETKSSESKHKTPVVVSATVPASTDSTTNKLSDNASKTNTDSSSTVTTANDKAQTNDEQQNNAENLSKSDSKTWASIVGFSNSLQQTSSRTSPSPTSSSSTSNTTSTTTTQLNQLETNSNDTHNNINNKQKVTKPFHNSIVSKSQQQENSFDIFDLNNRAFPPISINCKFV